MVTFSYTVPDAAPVITSAGFDNEYTLSFMWELIPCGNRRGIISGYYYQLQTDGSMIDDDSLYSNISSLTLSGLIPCTTYNFSILAMNEIGYGPKSTMDATTDITGKFRIVYKFRDNTAFLSTVLVLMGFEFTLT